MKRIEVELPFMGFYESIHDVKMDDVIQSHYTDEETGTELKPGYEDAIWNADIDYQAIRMEYCKDYVSELADEIELDLEFADLVSPKYYNFSTDRLFATIPEDQAQRIREEVQTYPEYPEWIRERFSSYDGFISNYDPEVTSEDWTRPELDACQWMVLIKLWYTHRQQEDPYNMKEWNDLEFDIAGEIEMYNYDSIMDATTLIDAEYEKLAKENK